MRRFVLELITFVALLALCRAAAENKAVNPMPMPPNRFAQQSDWWKHAVFYEIYPRSFADSNNDGTGDLNGITAHLDYLASLGVDAVWITPCYPSPQADFGYDVSDYRNVDPHYGTLADFDRLLAEGRKRGIKVIMDLVLNHTSDQHPWFVASNSSDSGPYRDFYVWRDGKADGQPPNNWTSLWSGPGWTFSPARKQWYHHFFSPQQPDLNWHNPRVEQAMFDVVRFWYLRGVYGFRLDAVDALFEDPQWRDNPDTTSVDGKVYQQHLMDHNQPEVHSALQKLRKVNDEFLGRVLVGETWTDDPTKIWAYYGTSNNELQMPMYFNVTEIRKLDAAEYRKKIEAIEANPVGGWPVFVLSNHDIVRHITRYGDSVHDEAIAKMMAAMLLTLRGTPILYYGEELGMQNNDPKRVEEVKDIIGKKNWPGEKGRDGERTPMQWDGTKNAGFNRGAATWLPVHENFKTTNAAAESVNPNSMLNWYRQLIRLRRTHAALYAGDYTVVNESDANVLAYVRKSGTEKVLVVLNMSGSPQSASFDPGQVGGAKGRVLAGVARELDLRNLSLQPFGVVIAEIE